MEPPAVVCDTAAAEAALAAGTDVVVIVAPPSTVPAAAPAAGEGRGRLAVLVGDPASETDRAAAAEMAAEVFARG